MKAKSLILILIAGGCGLVASIGISQVIGTGSGEAKVETVKILVAAQDLNIGDKLDETTVNLEEWPKDKVPEGALRSMEKVKDETTNSRMYKGEPLMEAKLMTSGAMNAPIPAGKSVAVLKVDSRSAPPLLQPGDKVDIAVVFRRSGEIKFTGTKTVLKKVVIYAVNKDTERTIDADGKKMDAKTISVLVTPSQFEMLMLVSEMGKVRIAQRSHSDDGDLDDDDGEFDIRELYGTMPEDASASVATTTPAPKAEPDPFTNLLSEGATAIKKANAAPFSMVMHTPEGMMRYVWHSDDELPEVIELDGSRGSGKVAPLPNPFDKPVASGSSNGVSNGPAINGPAGSGSSSKSGSASNDDNDGDKDDAP